MRILFITGSYSYGDTKRGEAYEHQNFLPALRRLGHEVEVLDSLERSTYPGFVDLNRAVLAKVEDWRPEVILFVPVLYEIWNETWDIIRRSGIAASICWGADDSWKYVQTSRFVARHFDGCVTTYRDKVAMFHNDGYDRVLESQWAADATRTMPPLPSSECEFHVTFIGTRYGNRSKFVQSLTNAGIRVDCFGHGWPNGPIAGERIAPILRNSRISLNFSGSGKWIERFQPKNRQLKARVFEVPGAGGFLLSEWAPGIERFYDTEREIATFRTNDELLEKARFYLSHPEIRDACAEAAFSRTVRDHTYDLRMGDLVSFASALRGGKPAGTGSIDWVAFERAVSRHQVTPALDLLRTLLVGGCNRAFGRKRGPRAARRLLFELSWRLMGEKTYSSSSLPGRLFYYES